MWLLMVVFWSLVIAFAYYAIKGNTSRTVAQIGPRATEILQERFARGEISAEEYRERRVTLETAGSAPNGPEG